MYHEDNLIRRARPFVALDMLILPCVLIYGLPCNQLPEICHERHVTSSWQDGLLACLLYRT